MNRAITANGMRRVRQASAVNRATGQRRPHSAGDSRARERQPATNKIHRRRRRKTNSRGDRLRHVLNRGRRGGRDPSALRQVNQVRAVDRTNPASERRRVSKVSNRDKVADKANPGSVRINRRGSRKHRRDNAARDGKAARLVGAASGVTGAARAGISSTRLALKARRRARPSYVLREVRFETFEALGAEREDAGRGDAAVQDPAEGRRLVMNDRGGQTFQPFHDHQSAPGRERKGVV